MSRLIATSLCWASFFSASVATERMALVIGNNAYEHSSRLVNPRNDAEAMADKLAASGFSVSKLLDGSQEQMETALQQFSSSLNRQSTALVYYAGHGIQVNGETYLLPVDAKADAPERLKYEAVNLNMVLDLMERSGEGAGLKVIILDACRENPFGRSWRGSRSAADSPHAGLAAPASTPPGTILAFATDPGRVASDGRGNNSPYTQGLLEHLFTPGLDIDSALRRVGASVQTMTHQMQNPWRNSNFNGEFAFVPGGAPVAAAMISPSRRPAPPVAPISQPAMRMVEMAPIYPKPLFIGSHLPAISIANLEKPDPEATRARLKFKVPEGTLNVAKGKPVTSSDGFPIIGELSLLTDGDAEGEDGCYVELLPGPQWVQIDLGDEMEVWKVLLWHYHKMAAVYHDVKLAISNDPDFKDGGVAIFNNDHDNSAGHGAGTDPAYLETRYGRLIDAQGVRGRYIRFYSNGNTSNEMNHYVEAMVFGRPL